jgi:hypothetical protein
VSVNGGYVRVHRKLTADPIWTRTAPAVLKVMIGFLLKANYQPTTWYDGKEEIRIPRGSFITTMPMMAKFCNVSLKQARAAFAHLERSKFSTFSRACGKAYGRAGGRAGGLTLVTICNYDIYQSPEVNEGIRLGVRLGTREGNKVINKNINTPPTPSFEGEETSLLDEVPFDTLDHLSERETAKPSPAPAAAHQATLAAVAASIHARHPSACGRRDCSVAVVEKQLAAILKHKRVPAGEREQYLRRVDDNHAGICRSEQWCKDGGEYAKALTNWLAPTKERYDVMVEANTVTDTSPRYVL